MHSEASQKLRRAVGGDRLVLLERVEELHKQVLDAHEAFREHWRAEHKDSFSEPLRR
jgi:hypothetical protein